MNTTVPQNGENRPRAASKRYSITSIIHPLITRARSKSIIHVSSKYESLDYDIWENELLVQEEQEKGFSHVVWLNVIRWILYLLVGVLTGVIAIIIDVSINKFTHYRYETIKYYLDTCSDDSCYYVNFIFWYLWIIIPVTIGTVVVIFMEPSAAGSGLPSVISHLNGVRIPRFTKLTVLVVKVISVISICSAGLAGGKEGPFIHLGSIIGDKITSMMAFNNEFLTDKIRYLSTNTEKRDLMAGGCAAGVSAAFGSPVGATLMSIEEGTSFWSVNLMWKIFFCAIVSCFTFNTIHASILDHPGQRTYLGLFYFGKFNESMIHYEYFELPIFVGIGIMGGLSGAIFVTIGMKITFLRDRYIQSNGSKLLDAMTVAFLTATLGIMSTQLMNQCQVGAPRNSLQVNCEHGSYNEFSVFWFNTHESILRLLFHSSPDSFSMITLVVFFIIYFFLSVILLGLNISAGIFLPSLLLGATYGRIVGMALCQIFPESISWAIPGKYALLGAAAHLGGVVRVTISLTVVIIEGTGATTFGFPLMLTLFTAKWIGDLFTESLYESQINLLGIPVLPNDPPPLTSDISATDLMNKIVYVFPERVVIKHIVEVLQKVPHHGFPVVQRNNLVTETNGSIKTCGQLHGFILRSQLLALLSNKYFKHLESNEEIRNTLKMFWKSGETPITIQSISLTEEERELYLDLSPYMNKSPYTISSNMSFPRIFRLFRSLGLRHVIVVNNRNEVTGIITRKDLSKLRLWRNATQMGLKELRIY